jgi:dTMP kinase
MKKKKNKGFFITFEGGEGVGKTTLIDRVFDYLTAKGHAVIKTREPGGTRLGQQIRDLVLHQKEFHPTKRAELFLFLADRSQHVHEVILPALEEEKIVLCDRFNDSTLAYQGAARAFDRAQLKSFCAFAVSDLVPDLTLFLDLDPEIGLVRAQKGKGGTYDRLEKEALSFHQKVRAAFLSFAKEEPERFHVIDATEPTDVVFTLAIQEIDSTLCLH